MPIATPPPLPRVLVVDDSATLRAVVQRLLEPAHQVLTAVTAEEALVVAPGFAPDVIICDLWLPGMSGADLCRLVRERPELSEVPFILITGVPDPAGRVTGLEAGADDYLHKPLKERELLARVASLLRLRRANQALAARSGELQRVNEALRTAQDRLVLTGKLASVGTLAAGLAHQINNPLSCIKSNAGALVGAVAEIARLVVPSGQLPSAALAAALAEVGDLSGEISGASRRLERIAADLRVISSPDVPAKETIDPGEAVEHALLVVGARTPAMPRIDLQVEPGPPIASMGRLLHQGLVPVFENAVLAAGPGGTVTIRVVQLNVGVEITLADSGPGIPPEVLPRIFDPFYSTRPQGQGSGLGLSVAWGIIHGLGGEISAESPPGGGALFRIHLPRGRLITTPTPVPGFAPTPAPTAAG
jgi:C4-dicarboxylate-specific signal transduction histidine kinase